jgi:transcriptional regulator with XRE-family HTH domain
MQSLGDRILLLRRSKRWTQKQLAEQVALSPNTIARVERNMVETLRGDTVAKLARVLSTSTDYLLGLSEESGQESDRKAAGLVPV